MLCDDCQKRPATMHITKIHNNKKVEKHLCAECANSGGETGLFTWDAKLSVHDLLKGMFSHEYPEVASSAAAKYESCDNCGMTYRDFSRDGKIGCGSCYNRFGLKLEPVIRRIHGASGHTGKIPKRGGAALSLKSRLMKLKHDLEKHISREEYEQAAQVRDEIRELEQFNRKEGV